MKCQYCEKPATFHITEVTTDNQPQELHLCEDHARIYLTPSDEPPDTDVPTDPAGQPQFSVSQTAEQLAQLDQRSCPVCGITFYEFRHAGRLGCPHDYVCFHDELEPLIVNIHGATTHVGKHPKHGVQATSHQTRLIQLRREMQDAVHREDYELASRLRDEIHELEQGQAE